MQASVVNVYITLYITHRPRAAEPKSEPIVCNYRFKAVTLQI